ncbi:MAG: CCA tRNA nucleotidyltransferase [Verrucomicrobia bacterium]|nr:CCA tRNA nucleotidyltransferase [Verrucomicrobiota bacterium]MBV9656680.1 CCA tRNA nucleotidyltransferase [Verrucomicrobiota bacterium]
MELAARNIVARLHAAGFQALFAGGCVRDKLRGVPPKDFDIATDARPEQVQALFKRTVAVGAHFGVVVVLEGGWQFEVATFRADGAYLDGRRPESVRFTTAREDAERRDFTVNGLFYDPLREETLDYVGGRADLEKKILRAIGEPAARFAEDKLRLLRAVRFAAALEFEIEAKTWEAVRAMAAQITSVSAERIRDELVKIFTAPTRLRGFDLLDASGLLRVVLPELDACKGCAQPPQFHPEGDVFVHTRLMLSLLPTVQTVSVPLVFSVLLHDIGKPPTFAVDPTGRIRFNGHEHVGARMTERVLERLRFSRAEIDATVVAVEQHMAFKDVPHMRVATLKRMLARPTIEDEMELHRVDCAGSHGMLDNYEFLRAKQEEFANAPLIPKPFINGRDLIALGLRPGPVFSEILDAAQTRQLEGAFADRDAALAWLCAAYGADSEKKRG